MKTSLLRIISLSCSLAAATASYLFPRLRIFAPDGRLISLSEYVRYCVGCDTASSLSLVFYAIFAASLLLVFANTWNLFRHPEKVGFIHLPRSKDAALEETKGGGARRELAGLAAVAAGSAGFLFFLDKSKLLALLLLLGGIGTYALLTRKKG